MTNKRYFYNPATYELSEDPNGWVLGTEHINQFGTTYAVICEKHVDFNYINGSVVTRYLIFQKATGSTHYAYVGDHYSRVIPSVDVNVLGQAVEYTESRDESGNYKPGYMSQSQFFTENVTMAAIAPFVYAKTNHILHTDERITL